MRYVGGVIIVVWTTKSFNRVQLHGDVYQGPQNLKSVRDARLLGLFAPATLVETHTSYQPSEGTKTRRKGEKTKEPKGQRPPLHSRRRVLPPRPCFSRPSDHAKTQK